MIINEIFYSLQGEGFLAGVPSVFVRLAGCTQRCSWCDTAYAWDEQAGREMTIEEIAEKVKNFNCRHIVITGGEPMLNDRLGELAEALKRQGGHVTIETSGLQYRQKLNCNLISVSPKLSNAEAAKMGSETIDNLGKLIGEYEYQLKFIVDCEADLEEIEQILSRLDGVDRGRVMLMPQATNRRQLLEKSPLVAEMCRNSGFAFSQRLHILLWDGQKGK